MRTLQASTLVTLLLLASLSAVFPHALATDTTIKGETTWSGAVLLTGNVTVANGTTLNIKPGTTIDGGDDHWILVKGTLIANDATFSSSHTPLTQGSHGAGLWVGLHVSATGHAVLTNVIINNAKTAVRNDGQLTGSDLTINDAYIGINNAGTATVANLTANDIDYDAVRNSGDFTVEEATITRVAGGVISSGTATISDALFIQAGSALRATAGQFDATRIGFDTVTVGIASQAGASMSVSSLTGTSVALTVDAGNSDDLTLSNMVIEGHRLMLASGATMVSGHDITFAGNLNETRATIDQRCSGACSWSQTTLTNVVWGLALSGGGTHTLSNVTAVATERNLDASGTGAVIATQLNLSGSDAAISLRGPDSDIDGASISLVSANSIGLDVLDGIHEWKNVELSKPYSSQDATSIGVKAWYSTIAVQALSITHFATGIDASDATITGNTITVADGKMTGIALHDSDVTVDSLSTRVFTTGVHMEGASTLHVTDWLADLHATPLNLDTDCTATVRNFQPQNTQASSSDALGDGSLLYGGSTTASIATSSSDFFEETPVTFTDLAGSPVEATILVHGFTLMSNSNGAATLPLLAQGSTVDVSLGGAGIRVVLYGATMGQSVQVAVVPQGDKLSTSEHDQTDRLTFSAEISPLKLEVVCNWITPRFCCLQLEA
jgi:hypothetical protein